MKRALFTFAAAMALTLAACADKKTSTNGKEATAKTDSAQTETEATAPVAPATLDGVEQLVAWETGPMTITRNGDEIVLSTVEGYHQLRLKPNGDGTYNEISGKKEAIGQSALFKVQKVDGVTTLSAYDGQALLFALVSFDNLKSFKDRGYKRMLTSRFDPVDGQTIEITNDVMKGLPLPDAPDMSYFFTEDGKGGLSNFIRLSPGRIHLNFEPADKGVVLHFCNMLPDTGDLEVLYDKENTISLHYANDPGWPWLSTDVLDSDFIIYNFDKPFWELMLSKLEKAEKPNEVERWNRDLLENLIANGDPYSGLASSDY